MADASFNSDSAKIPYLIDRCVFEIDGREVVAPVERLNPKVLSETEIAARCGSKRFNEKVLSACGMRYGPMPSSDEAVYVIGNASRTAVKIGVSRNPLGRLLALQGGSHEQLKVTHLFWTTRKEAYGLEKFALRVAGKVGKRLKGEWTDFSPEEAAHLIAVLIVEAGLGVSDSSLYRRAMKRANLLATDGHDYPSEVYHSDPFHALSRKNEIKRIDFDCGGC